MSPASNVSLDAGASPARAAPGTSCRTTSPNSVFGATRTFTAAGMRPIASGSMRRRTVDAAVPASMSVTSPTGTPRYCTPTAPVSSPASAGRSTVTSGCPANSPFP